jgi:hypothetical protein
MEDKLQERISGIDRLTNECIWSIIQQSDKVSAPEGADWGD